MRETRDGLFFKKTPTEQLEAESQVDAPEATVPVSSEEQESPVDDQQKEEIRQKDEIFARRNEVLPKDRKPLKFFFSKISDF